MRPTGVWACCKLLRSNGVPSEVANGTPFNKKLHLISRSAQSAIPKFTSAKQVNLNVRLFSSASDAADASSSCKGS